MKLIKSSYAILEQKPGLECIYEAIETAGRLCYKSIRPEGKTAKDFVDMLIKNKHFAMLEHGTVYLKYKAVNSKGFFPELIKYNKNSYSKYLVKDGIEYVTTNMRVLIENNWLDDLQYLCEPTEYHEKRVTVHFTTSIGITRELIRHRKFSFANESTRYCNYSKDKFDNEITFIIPYWIDLEEGSWEVGQDFMNGLGYKKEESDHIIFPKSDEKKDNLNFLVSLIHDEQRYLQFIRNGHTPQEAREVLPLATKSELIMTGFVSDWKHFFRLRTSIIAETGKPHPDVSALADPLYTEFIDKYIG